MQLFNMNVKIDYEIHFMSSTHQRPTTFLSEGTKLVGELRYYKRVLLKINAVISEIFYHMQHTPVERLQAGSIKVHKD